MSDTPEMNEAELDAMIKRAGLSPDDTLRKELHAAWPHVAAMTKRVRTPRERAAEPAHIFSLPIPSDMRLDD